MNKTPETVDAIQSHIELLQGEHKALEKELSKRCGHRNAEAEVACKRIKCRKLQIKEALMRLEARKRELIGPVSTEEIETSPESKQGQVMETSTAVKSDRQVQSTKWAAEGIGSDACSAVA